MPWPTPDFRVCQVCGGLGIFPLNDIADRTDLAVCLCKWGKAWRFDRQTDPKRRQTKVAPLWMVWASEFQIPLRSAVVNGSEPDTGACIDLIEKWYSAEDIKRMFAERRIA